MEPILNSAMCRCCASEGTFKDIHTKYHWMGDEEVYSVMLKECFDITLSSPQGDQSGICEVCITQLRNAFNFKKQVLHTEEQFQHMLGNKVQDIKLEYTKDSSEEPEDRPVSEADNSDPDFTPSIKEEEDEPESKPKAKKRAAKSTATRAKKPKLEAPETSTQSMRPPAPISRSLLGKLRLDSGNGVSVKAVRSTSATQPFSEPTTLKKVGPSSSTVIVKEVRTIKKKEYSEPIPKGVASRTFEKVKHNTIQMLKFTNATPIRRHDGVKFVCSFCNDAYVDPRELKTHTIERHEYDDKNDFEKGKRLAYYMAKLDITSLHCKLCKLDCETVQEIFEHLMNTHNVVIHRNVNNQILPFKFVGENLTCFVCQYISTSFKTLQAHMLKHFGSFHCDTCGKSFGNSRKLAQHRNTHSSGTFICNTCEKVFTTAQKRNMHIVRVHTRPMLYKCGFCDEKFQTYEKKLKHLVAEHDAPSHTFKCHACDKMFRKASLLSRHARKDHLMERQHKCSHCDKAFFEAFQLKSHMIKHDAFARVQCDNCLKYFKSKKSLKSHMQIHMDERKFKCNQCDMAFVYRVSWKSHMTKTHGYEVVGVKN